MRRLTHFAFLLVGFCTSAFNAAGQRQLLPVRDDPLALFAELMPVLSHERCANCHGATDPYRGFYHPGAVASTAVCWNSCHTASPKWNLAPPGMAFFQKTTRQLCEHFAALDPPSGFLGRHLQTDELIGLAFIGRRGNAVPQQFAQPPPQSRAEFMRHFQTWVRDGGAACSGWEGTITEEQTISDTLTLAALGGTVTHMQAGKRTLTITVKDGQATVSSSVNGFDDNRHVVTSGSCTVTIFAHKVYRIVGQNSPPAPPQPAVSTALGTSLTLPAPTPVIAAGAVRVGLDAAGNYRIQVTPPGETIETTESGSATNNCGAPTQQASHDTNRITWKPFVIDIFGTLPNPRDRRQLKGDSDIDMTTADTDRSIGIEVYGSASEVDGRNIPFKVKRTWDLRRLP